MILGTGFHSRDMNLTSTGDMSLLPSEDDGNLGNSEDSWILGFSFCLGALICGYIREGTLHYCGHVVST